MSSTAVVSVLRSDDLPESLPKNQTFTASEFIQLVRQRGLRSFRQYAKIVLVTQNLCRLKRRLLWMLLLKFTSTHAKLMSVTGDIREITWPYILRELGHLILEVIWAVSEYRYVSRATDELIRQSATPIRVTPSKDASTVVYIKGGLPSSGQAGGSVTHVAGVVNSLVRFDYKVELWCASRNPLLDQQVRQETFALYDRFPNLYELENLHTNKTLLPKFCPERYPDGLAFVYERYSAYSYVGVALAQKLGVPLVLEFNSSPLWTTRNWGGGLVFPGLAAKVENTVLKKAVLVTVVSEVLRDQLVDQGVAKEKILVNPNGVDPSRFHPGIDGTHVRAKYDLGDKTVIGFIGTFGPWQGTLFLARAIVALKDYPKRLNLHFFLIGDGQERLATQQILRNNNCLDYCTFTGMIPPARASEYLAACDILVSPQVPNPDGSDFWGSPVKLFEYMAMGKGIVASRLNQIGKILQHKETALLVEPNNVDELREAIMTLAEDVSLRNELGEIARRQVIQHYTWEQHTQRILKKLQEVC